MTQCKLNKRFYVQDSFDALTIAEEYGYYSAALYLKGIGYSLEAALYILLGIPARF